MKFFVLQKASTAPFAEQSTVSMATNFTGTLDVCNVLFPILRDHARFVDVGMENDFVSCQALVNYKVVLFLQITPYVTFFIVFTNREQVIL